MFGKSFRLFKLLGFEVKIDLSWLVLAVLITWSLAKGVFPAFYDGLSTETYWWMGAFGALGLFLSIILHELAHALVARKYGIPMHGITLFIFGGVAQMTQEPPSAKSEFMMAIAGPIASVLIGLGLYGIAAASQGVIFSRPIFGIISYLAFINIILAAFNMVPAFPLDGGRVLRSILWNWKNNLRRATRISSAIGSGFGILLIVLGIFAFISGNFVGGLWWFLIGMFLRSASQMSYQQLLLRTSLEGERIECFMERKPMTVSPALPLQDLVENYIYKFQYKMFPVVEQEKLLGCVTTKQIKDIPKEEWEQRTVGEVAKDCSTDNSISPQADAVKALSTMKRTGNSRLMVVENSHLVGIVALKDMLNYLALKVELEES